MPILKICMENNSEFLTSNYHNIKISYSFILNWYNCFDIVFIWKAFHQLCQAFDPSILLMSPVCCLDRILQEWSGAAVLECCRHARGEASLVISFIANKEENSAYNYMDCRASNENWHQGIISLPPLLHRDQKSPVGLQGNTGLGTK